MEVIASERSAHSNVRVTYNSVYVGTSRQERGALEVPPADSGTTWVFLNQAIVRSAGAGRTSRSIAFAGTGSVGSLLPRGNSATWATVVSIDIRSVAIRNGVLIVDLTFTNPVIVQSEILMETIAFYSYVPIVIAQRDRTVRANTPAECQESHVRIAVHAITRLRGAVG